ncbi:MAG: hypothetical protein AAB217_03820 [Chloroflexota bacterium]
MSSFFLDSRALVKRYLTEAGSFWIPLAANQTLLLAGLPTLTFVAADDDLLTAARQEGLQAENPNAHSS